MMATNYPQGPARETAKIYQFPIGGRVKIADRRDDFRTPRIHAVVTGNNWYHEAAIEDAFPEREH
jgi:hypothetical protein